MTIIHSNIKNNSTPFTLVNEYNFLLYRKCVRQRQPMRVRRPLYTTKTPQKIKHLKPRNDNFSAPKSTKTRI